MIWLCPNNTEARQPADLPASAALRAHDEDSESTQNAQINTGTAVKEPAGLQGEHLSHFHVDVRSECPTRELVEQMATRHRPGHGGCCSGGQ